MKTLSKIWPFSAWRRSAVECWQEKEEEGSARPHHTPLEDIFRPEEPEVGMETNALLTCDGVAMSRMTKPAAQDTTDHSPRDTVPPLFLAIQIGDKSGLHAALEQDPEAAHSARYGGFLPLHAACHYNNFYALTCLLQHGVKVDAVDGLGHSPLHLAVALAWHDGVGELLRHGASPNTLCDPPPTVKEVRIETPFHAAVRRGDLTSTFLLLQHNPDFTQRDSDQCSVLHLAAQTRSLELTRQLLNEKKAKVKMAGGDRHGNSVLHKALMAPCEAACEASLRDLVKELVEAGADVKHVNTRGESPLYLAAYYNLPRVVETLLDLGADPTQVTRSGGTLLHAACQQGSATSLSHLLATGQVKDLVTAHDDEGHDPFYHAVHSGSIDCCELLLTNGDHLIRVDKSGETRCSVILRHLPSAAQLLTKLFDAHVRLSNLPQHDPNFRVTFDYSVICSEADSIQSTLISELSASSLEALLKHPLLESFLFLKWGKIKPFFYCSVSLYFLFLLIHTTFIVMTFGGQPWDWRLNSGTYKLFLALHVLMFFLILVPDLTIMFANFKKYIRQWETFSKFVALASSAVVIFSFIADFFAVVVPLATPSTRDQDVNVKEGNLSESVGEGGREEGPLMRDVVRHAAALSAFFSWVEFMMLLGRFPSLGSYVLMFTRVARSIIKFLAAFSSLIIGFAVSFLVMFQQDAAFSSLPLSFIKTLMMMIGEIDYSNFINNLDPLGGIFLILFLFLVCVLMANLLIGLAVNDLPDLQRQGKIRRLSKEASYLVSYERLMVVARNLPFFPRRLRILLTTRCKIPKAVNVWPNKDRSSVVGHKEDQHHVPSETLQEAVLLGTEDSKEDFNIIVEDDLVAQFKSFKVKYTRDRRQLNRRLAQLPDMATTEAMLKQRLDHIQQTMQNQILHLFHQLQQQHFVCNQCHQRASPAEAILTVQQPSAGAQGTHRSISHPQYGPSARQHVAPTSSLPEQSNQTWPSGGVTQAPYR